MNKHKIYEILKQLNFYELSIALFPLIIISRSFSINLYLAICLCIIFLNYNKIKSKIKKQNWIFLYFLFLTFIVLNSIFAEDQKSSLISSISQIKFLTFSLFILVYVENFKSLKKILFIQSILLFLVSLDIIYQFLNDGINIFGFDNKIINSNRFSGIFGDESIVASFILNLSLPIIAYFLSIFNFSKPIYRTYIIIFISSIFLAMILSGERMNLLIFLTLLMLLNLFLFNIKLSLFLNIGVILITIISYFNIPNFQNRVNNFYDQINRYENNDHIRLFSSALSIWSENKFTGVGNKNFRVVCSEDDQDFFIDKKRLCSTHPHNLYFELLSETGLIGLFLFFIFIFYFFYYVYKRRLNIKTFQKPIFVSSILLLLAYLFPLRSSGSIFSTFYGIFFWYNLGIVLLFIKFNFKIGNKKEF